MLPFGWHLEAPDRDSGGTDYVLSNETGEVWRGISPDIEAMAEAMMYRDIDPMTYQCILIEAGIYAMAESVDALLYLSRVGEA